MKVKQGPSGRKSWGRGIWVCSYLKTDFTQRSALGARKLWSKNGRSQINVNHRVGEPWMKINPVKTAVSKREGTIYISIRLWVLEEYPPIHKPGFMFPRLTWYPFKFHCGGEEIQNACCIEQQNSIDEPEKKKHDPMNDRSSVRVWHGASASRVPRRVPSLFLPLTVISIFFSHLCCSQSQDWPTIPTLAIGISVRNWGVFNSPHGHQWSLKNLQQTSASHQGIKNGFFHAFPIMFSSFSHQSCHDSSQVPMSPKTLRFGLSGSEPAKWTSQGKKR